VSFFDTIIIAIGLSADAFALAICLGMTLKVFSLRKAVIVGLYFGVLQALMPILGYLVASVFSETIVGFSHWIAFALLVAIGLKMVVGGLKKGHSQEKSTAEKEASLSPIVMLPLAIATSLDALAIGFSLSFLKANLLLSVSVIGVTTLVLSTIGVRIGKTLGAKLHTKAELFGGIILILIGIKILLERLFAT